MLCFSKISEIIITFKKFLFSYVFVGKIRSHVFHVLKTVRKTAQDLVSHINLLQDFEKCTSHIDCYYDNMSVFHKRKTYGLGKNMRVCKS